MTTETEEPAPETEPAPIPAANYKKPKDAHLEAEMAEAELSEFYYMPRDMREG